MSTRLAPVHGGRRAAADALEGGGLGGEVLAVVTQRADGVRGHHVAPRPPSVGRSTPVRATMLQWSGGSARTVTSARGRPTPPRRPSPPTCPPGGSPPV